MELTDNIQELNHEVFVKGLAFDNAIFAYDQAMKKAVLQMIDTSNNDEEFSLLSDHIHSIKILLAEKYIRLLSISKVPQSNCDTIPMVRIKVEYIDSERTEFILFDWLTSFEKRKVVDRMFELVQSENKID